MIPPTPEQNRPAVLLGKFPYGWDAVATTRPTGELDVHGKPLQEQLPFPQHYRKQFTHPGGTIIVGAARRGGYWEKFELKEPENYNEMPVEAQARARASYRRKLVRKNQCKPTRYIVWGDRSLRRLDNVLRKQFAGMTPEQQQDLIAQAATGAVQ
jgi:hypothetical protein